MKLISGLLSNNAAKVRIALKEKGVDFETIEVPWTKESAWEPKPAVLLEANPRAEVPVLMDDDLILWDSTVINEYLETKYPSPALIPTDLRPAALCRLWEDEGDFNQSHVGVLIAEVFLGEPGAPLNDASKKALAALDAFCDRLDEALEGQDYLCGEFSLADISVFMTLAFATTLGTEITQPALQGWYERMMSRPVIKEEFEAILNGVASL